MKQRQRVLPLSTPVPLTLVSATTYPDGTAIHVYRPRTPRA
jgi:hypothetical protein